MAMTLNSIRGDSPMVCIDVDASMAPIDIDIVLCCQWSVSYCIDHWFDALYCSRESWWAKE